jgi:hypothetical protein
MKKQDLHAKTPVANEQVNVLNEEQLARIEADPDLQQMAKDAERDFREGRFYTESEVREALRQGSLDDLIEKRERAWRERGRA